LGLVMSFAILETLLRLFPPGLIRDDIYYRYDKDVGWMPIPNQKSKNYTSCLEIDPILFNSQGFRDKEWERNENYKIAVLGDSFMQGSEVPEGMYVSSMLEKSLSVRTLNGGVNNLGTLHEYLLFKKYIAIYKPNLVILFIYPINDVVDNSYRIRSSSSRSLWPTARLLEGGNVEIIYPEVRSIENFDAYRAFIKKYSKTFLLLRRLYDYYEGFRITGSGIIDDQTSRYYQIYMPENEQWTEAWKIIEHYVLQLRKEIHSSGGELVVVRIPEYIRLSESWENELRELARFKEIPKGFDFTNPVRKIRELTERNKIRLIELESFFKSYRDTFHMKSPYFSYRCDGHLNPLGQFLATSLIAKYLIVNNMIPLDEISKMNILSRIERNIKLGPIDILSEDGYRQIYKTGRFTGNTNIIKLLSN
jgi:hypothetical protein